MEKILTHTFVFSSKMRIKTQVKDAVSNKLFQHKLKIYVIQRFTFSDTVSNIKTHVRWFKL